MPRNIRYDSFDNSFYKTGSKWYLRTIEKVGDFVELDGKRYQITAIDDQTHRRYGCRYYYLEGLVESVTNVGTMFVPA